MKVAVMGAGIGGTWLSVNLVRQGHEVVLYDKPKAKLGCACAWGTETRQFREFMRLVGVDPEPLIVRHLRWIDFQGVHRLATDNFCTINRPAMIRAVLKVANLRVVTDAPDFSRVDRVIDCTGHARAFLAPSPQDLKIVTKQVIARHDGLAPDTVYLRFGRVGYWWAFPLWVGKAAKAGNQWHIGWGELGNTDLMEQAQREVGFSKVACDCDWHFKEPEYVRLAPPRFMEPFFGGVDPSTGALRPAEFRPGPGTWGPPMGGSVPVWGCCEAAGAVSPVVGEGIIPGLRCAQILLENWDDWGAYRAAVLREFAWMDNEYRAIRHFMAGHEIRGVLTFLRCLKNGDRFGLRVGWRDLPAILKVVRAWRREARQPL